MPVTHWRVYFTTAIGENGEHYVDVDDPTGEQVLKQLLAKSRPDIITIVTGVPMGGRESRSLRVLTNHIVAVDPRVDG